jgi:asparagine synthase (glutamine-hydrolysing)
MCGICGQYNYKGSAPIVKGTIERMTRTLFHRGPDDEGYYVSGPLAFGFRRLSIIDLDGGHQPMSDRARSVWVVFNGEIYNFPELKKELESQGHVFSTRSDTEVIIHGYKQWGEDVFNHLNGMFGIALWDERKRKLIIARDPMGIKQIYYKMEAGRLLFGSEIRPLLAATEEKPQVDPLSLNLFLRYRYTPSPLTLFKGIKKLAPGTMLVFENGSSRLERWYAFRPTPFAKMPTFTEAKQELFEIYDRAVKRHLLSDVPVGLLLSGGVDSGLLLGLMNLHGTTWPTYTVGYGRTFKDDELAYAADTARIYSARNVPIQITRETFETSLPKIVSSMEEPVASSSIVPMYFLCERARRDVKVALIGQGPDELFGGYNRHLGVHYGSYWRSLPAWMRKSASAVIRRLPKNESLKRGVYSLDTNERIKRYQNVFSLMPGDGIDGLFQQGLLPPNAGDQILKSWEDYKDLIEGVDELGGFQLLEIHSSLPDELLLFADKLSMAHSLEVRVPFLDREIVEYVQRLSADFKIRYGCRKWLHRKVCERFMPGAILNRKKRGFAVNVVDDWFRSSAGKKMDGLLYDRNSKMYDFLRPAAVKTLLDEHISGKNDNHKVLFSLVVFEEWLQNMT